MTAVCGFLVLLASAQTSLAADAADYRLEAVGTIPAPWVLDRYGAILPPLIDTFALADGGGEPVIIRVNNETGDEADARLSVRGEAIDGVATIRLEGRGWKTESERGRETLDENAAHEIAHLWQLRIVARYPATSRPFEPRWWHEGAAEALALEALEETGIWSDAELADYRAASDERCARAMAKGPLITRLEGEEETAVYACGLILVEAAADAANLSVRDLYWQFATSGMSPVGAGQWIAARTGRSWLVGAWDFATADFSQGNPALIIRSFRAGRP